MNFLNKINTNAGLVASIVLVLLLLNTCGHRSIKKELSRTKSEIDSLKTLVDEQYSKREMDLRMQIYGLEQEKSNLYNLNYIVYTKQRPDDRMHEIDMQIDSLEVMLNK